MYNDILNAAEDISATDLELGAIDLNAIDVNGAEMELGEIEAVRRRFNSPQGAQKALQTAAAMKKRGFVAGQKAAAKPTPFAKARAMAGRGNRPLTEQEQLILSLLEQVNKQLASDLLSGNAYIRTQRHFIKDRLLASKNIHNLQENATATKYGLTSIANRQIPPNSAFAMTHVGVYIARDLNATENALKTNPAAVNYKQNTYSGGSVFIPEAIQNGGLILKRQTTEIADLQLYPFFSTGDTNSTANSMGNELLVKLATPELFNSQETFGATIRLADDVSLPTQVGSDYVNYFAMACFVGIEVVKR